MKKINILKKNEEFGRIIKTVRPTQTQNFLFYLEKLEADNYMFGFVVSKKIGKAVTRNKIRRRMKNIIQKNKYKSGFVCIVMCKRDIARTNFAELSLEINKFLIKNRMVVDKE